MVGYKFNKRKLLVIVEISTYTIAYCEVKFFGRFHREGIMFPFSNSYIAKWNHITQWYIYHAHFFKSNDRCISFCVIPFIPSVHFFFVLVTDFRRLEVTKMFKNISKNIQIL